MEEWQKSFFEMLDTASREVEQFFQEVTEEVIEVVDSLFEFSEEITEQVQIPLVNELEQFFNQLVEPVIDVYLEIEQFETASPPEQFVSYVEPQLDKNPVCMGCRHYHGYVYGGNLLVCGMHPYGWEGESCPDWESHYPDDCPDNPF
jgi:hypothetical protein